jgi:Zn-finger nucleic acid-binding protein
MTTAKPSTKIKLNVAAFVEDYAQGASEAELIKKHGLKHRHLDRLVGVLKKKGHITPKEEGLRKDNLRIRFGDEKGPPKPIGPGGLPVDPDTGLTLHCPSCGGTVRRDAETCEYCGSYLDFSLKGKTVNCAHCYARTPAGSRFCIRCGRPPKPGIGDGEVREDRLCPRCSLPMRGQTIGDYPLLGCPECNGLFLRHETFEMMQDGMDRVIVPTDGKKGDGTSANTKVVYVRCPVCRKMMNRKNFAVISGVIVDLCKDHGIWFDFGELETIMNFIARGGLQTAKAKEIERLKAEDQLRQIRNIQAAGPRQSQAGISGDFSTTDFDVDLFDLVRGIVSLFKG